MEIVTRCCLFCMELYQTLADLEQHICQDCVRLVDYAQHIDLEQEAMKVEAYRPK